MATNYPTSLDNSTSLPYPSSTSARNAPSLAGGQDNQNDSLIALQTKLGIGASTPTSGKFLTGTGTGTSSWANTVPAGTVVGTSDSQTLTNKTLTSPTISSPTITNATISTDLLTGYTSANIGSIYGLSVNSGSITGITTLVSNLSLSGTLSVTGNTTLTSFTNWDGWLNPNETWTYASASTFTVSGDQTVKYSKGTKLKFTQTTVKYAVVASVSYSVPNTTVTIIVNTDYVIANAAISGNYYSYTTNPQGFPATFNFTAAITAPTGTAPTYSQNSCSYQVQGNFIIANYILANSAGGTAGAGAVTLFVSTPVAASIATRIGYGAAYNGGTAINAKVIMNFLPVYDPGNLRVYLAGDSAYNVLASDQNNAVRYIQITLTYQF